MRTSQPTDKLSKQWIFTHLPMMVTIYTCNIDGDELGASYEFILIMKRKIYINLDENN